MSKGKLIVLLAVGFVALIISLPSQRQASRAFTANYNANRICDDALTNKFDFSQFTGNNFTIPLREGCFGGVVYMPRVWHNWTEDSAGDTTGFWVAIWIVGERSGRGPFGANDKFELTYNKARWQGHGTISFYTNDVPAESKTETNPNIIVKPPPDAPSESDKSTPLTAVYAKQFCKEHPADDHSEEDGDDFTITLVEGCFAGPYQIPSRWRASRWDKSQDHEDWATLWCEGRTEPSAIHPYYESFTDGDLNPGCRKFYLQGKGSIHFTVLATGKPRKHMVRPSHQ